MSKVKKALEFFLRQMCLDAGFACKSRHHWSPTFVALAAKNPSDWVHVVASKDGRSYLFASCVDPGETESSVHTLVVSEDGVACDLYSLIPRRHTPEPLH